MEAGCVFCTRSMFEERLIAEDNFCFWISTLGQIEEGYTLVVPRINRTCLGDYGENDVKHFTKFLSSALEITTAEYQRPLIFEHGDVGQTIKHAHLHIVPAPIEIDLLPALKKDFPYVARIKSISELKAIRELEDKYLFYGNQCGEYFVFPITHWQVVPPQYLRVILAAAFGRSERANWKTMDPNLDRELWTKTRDKLQERYKNSISA